MEILGEFKKRQQEARDYLAENAGLDPLRDRWFTGVIAAYDDVLHIELEKEETQ